METTYFQVPPYAPHQDSLSSYGMDGIRDLDLYSLFTSWMAHMRTCIETCPTSLEVGARINKQLWICI